MPLYRVLVEEPETAAHAPRRAERQKHRLLYPIHAERLRERGFGDKDGGKLLVWHGAGPRQRHPAERDAIRPQEEGQPRQRPAPVLRLHGEQRHRRIQHLPAPVRVLLCEREQGGGGEELEASKRNGMEI